MKSITIKQVPITRPDGSTMTLNYLNQIRLIIRAPSNQQQGADIEELRRSIRVLDALDKSDGKTLELEDSDYEYMKERIRSARFSFADPAIVQFVDDVTQA